MPRINEHRFEINDEEYLLTWFDKPRLTKNGIEQKVKPLLREYITSENLPIQLAMVMMKCLGHLLEKYLSIFQIILLK